MPARAASPAAPAAPPRSLRARAGAAARRRAVADPGAALRVFAVAFALSIAVALLFPAPALANPITDAIEDAIQSVLGWVFERVMAGLFGGIQGQITEMLATWLVAIPNFDPDAQQQYVEGTARSSIDAARQATSMLALGGLGAVMTISVMRYWLSGLSMSGSGGLEAFEGLSRSVLAVGMILAWPEAFRVVVALTNTATDTLLGWPSVQESVAGLWGWTTAITAGAFALSAPVAVIITIIVFVAFALLMLGLVLMKIMLTAGTALIYVLMPIAIVLWPLPETSWVARVTGRAFLVCLLIPITWTVIFITFAALGADFFTLRGQGGLLDRLIVKPLAAIGMLGLSIVIPKALGKAALMGAINATGGRAGAGGAGFMSRMASSLAARRADAALSPHVPTSWGGKLRPPSGSGGHGGFAGAAKNMFASMTGRTAATGGGTRGGGTRGGGTRGGGNRGGTRGGRTRGGPRGGGPGQGQPGGQPGGRRHRPTMSDMRQAAARWAAMGGPHAAHVQGALAQLTPQQRSRVADAARTMSPRDFQRQMFASAQNPAHADDTKAAYFILGSAGSSQVASFTGGGSPSGGGPSGGGPSGGGPSGGGPAGGGSSNGGGSNGGGPTGGGGPPGGGGSGSAPPAPPSSPTPQPPTSSP